MTDHDYVRIFECLEVNNINLENETFSSFILLACLDRHDLILLDKMLQSKIQNSEYPL